jgi:hypothetical protein
MKTLIASITIAFALIGLSATGTAAEPEKNTEPKGRLGVWSSAIEGNTFTVESVQLEPSENQVRFEFGSAAQQSMEQMRERLKDPQQRIVLRQERRQLVEQMHPDIEEVLGMGAATKEKLFELLTDEQMERLDAAMADRQDHRLEIQARADAETKRLASLRDLLGPDGLQEFQQYLATRGEREQVRVFDELLTAPDKLQPEQKEKLIELFADKNRVDRDSNLRAHRLMPPSMKLAPSADELRRDSQLRTIELNEVSLRAMEESSPLMAKRAAGFLSPIQLDVFSRMNQERAAAQRRWVEQARLQAGLPPQIPERSDIAPLAWGEVRTPMTGDVTFEFTVTVNRSPAVTITHTGPNAKPILFEAGEGLWMEAMPTLFEDHWLDVHLGYYEQVNGEKRRLEEERHFGTLTRMPDGSPGGGGMSTDMVAGTKGYAVDTRVRVVVP